MPTEMIKEKLSVVAASATTALGIDATLLNILPDLVSGIGSTMGLVLSVVLIRYWLKKTTLLNEQIRRTKEKRESNDKKKDTDSL